MSNFIDITSRKVEDTLQVTARLRPMSLADWCLACEALQEALCKGSGPLELHLKSPAESPQALALDEEQEGRQLAELGEGAAQLHQALERRAGFLVVVASGHVAGPLLSLALGADLLILRDGMEGSLLIWEDRPLPLPGDLVALAARLGRARALLLALAGGSVGAEELRDRGGALAGEAGEKALEAARSGSRVAQLAAASLRQGRQPGRRGAEALERAAFALCFGEPDRAEGIAAFRERRQPAFSREEPGPDSKSPRNAK